MLQYRLLSALVCHCAKGFELPKFDGFLGRQANFARHDLWLGPLSCPAEFKLQTIYDDKATSRQYLTYLIIIVIIQLLQGF
jgi:hypothetical protein